MLHAEDHAQESTGQMHTELLSELRIRRRGAESLLTSLISAKAECERQLARFKRTDMVAKLTGASALDRAITSTRSMIASLDRALAAAHRELLPERTLIHA